MHALKITNDMKEADVFRLFKRAGEGRHALEGDVGMITDPSGPVAGFCFEYTSSYCKKNGLQMMGPENEANRPLTFLKKENPEDPGVGSVIIRDHQWDEDLVKITLADRAVELTGKVTAGQPLRVPYDDQLIRALRNHCYNLEQNPYSVSRDGEEIVIKFSDKDSKSTRAEIRDACEKVALTGAPEAVHIDEEQVGYVRMIVSKFNRTIDERLGIREVDGQHFIQPIESAGRPRDPESFRGSVIAAIQAVKDGEGAQMIYCGPHREQYVRTIVSPFNKEEAEPVSVYSVEGGMLLSRAGDIIDYNEVAGRIREALLRLPPAGDIAPEQYDELRAVVRAELEEIYKRVPERATG